MLFHIFSLSPFARDVTIKTPTHDAIATIPKNIGRMGEDIAVLNEAVTLVGIGAAVDILF
jgi:hypothetical protein